MKETESELQTIDLEKIKTAVKLHTPLEITTYTIPHNMELYIRDVMSTFLKECNQQHMEKYLNFCLGELLTNAKKANTKRIYFKEKNLDIFNPQDYKSGMKTFKEDTLNDIDYYLTKQKEEGLYVKLSLLFDEENVIVEIKNNSVICEEEKQRINEKLNSVKQYKNEKDVLSNVIDQTEGAGLGIIIIILMLQKIGLIKEDYQVFSTEKETITKFKLPLNTEVQTGIETACLECVKTQTKIPVFEEEIEELTLELKETDLNKKKIIDIITKDVTLTALLLKNSAKIDTDCCKISKAIDLIGFENLSSIFNKNNPDIRLIQKSEDKRDLWKHAYYVAFYAYNFVINFASKENFLPEEIFVFALLHDIESILMEVITLEQENTVKENCSKKGISEKSFSMIKNECCNSLGGCMATQNWGLPSRVSEAIKFHNNLDKSPKNIYKLISILYLADFIDYYSEGKIDFYQINEKIRNEFQIDSEEKLRIIIDRVKEKINY